MSAAFVYVISGDHGRQKIGSSDNPQQRIKDLQTGSPYPLKFEFIGETENQSAGGIEVEAHFMLNQHRAEGEWFVVPSDVAITAVMAAAHRLGYRCKPVDVDQVKGATFQIGAPLWQKLLMIPIAIIALYYFIPLFAAFDSGRIDTFVFIVGGVAVILGIKVAHWLLIKVVVQFLRFDAWMHPEQP
jgi:hypothetical protein